MGSMFVVKNRGIIIPRDRIHSAATSVSLKHETIVRFPHTSNDEFEVDEFYKLTFTINLLADGEFFGQKKGEKYPFSIRTIELETSPRRVRLVESASYLAWYDKAPDDKSKSQIEIRMNNILKHIAKLEQIDQYAAAHPPVSSPAENEESDLEVETTRNSELVISEEELEGFEKRKAYILDRIQKSVEVQTTPDSSDDAEFNLEYILTVINQPESFLRPYYDALNEVAKSLST